MGLSGCGFYKWEYGVCVWGVTSGAGGSPVGFSLTHSVSQSLSRSLTATDNQSLSHSLSQPSPAQPKPTVTHSLSHSLTLTH